MSDHFVTVRAIPVNGHTHRWRIDIPWSKEPVRVKVCDNPKPHRRNARGGVEEFSGEISPKELAELEADPQISVSLVGDPGASISDVNAAKARAAELEYQLTATRRELSAFHENDARMKALMQKEMEEAGARVAGLEHELAATKAQLAHAGGKAVEEVKARLEKALARIAELEQLEQEVARLREMMAEKPNTEERSEDATVNESPAKKRK